MGSDLRDEEQLNCIELHTSTTSVFNNYYTLASRGDLLEYLYLKMCEFYLLVE